MYEVELRPFVAEQMTPLGPVKVQHPIEKIYANGAGQTPVLVGYFFTDTGHLSFVNSKLLKEQVEFITAEVEKKHTVKTSSQAKALVDEPDVPGKKKDDVSDLEEAGL